MDLPKDIQDKINKVHADVDHRLAVAHRHLVTDITGNISFAFSISAPRDVLTEHERAQSICFVTRYDALPEFSRINVVRREEGLFVSNLTEMRAVLNEYRSIIQNKKDSIHYKHIHKFVRDKLLNEDDSKDLSITANHQERGDITKEFCKALDERSKAIRSLIKYSEFSYIYNGILQHSDQATSHRFLEDYSSGEINYIFMYHALIASNIKYLLGWHYRLFNVLTFPKIGPL